MVLDGGGTEEQSAGDVPVGGVPYTGRVRLPVAVLAGGSQFGAGPVGEAVRAHLLEAVECGAQLLARTAAAALPPNLPQT